MQNLRQDYWGGKQVSSTGHVTLGGICPRIDNGEAATRGTEINSRLQQLAEARGCIHIKWDLLPQEWGGEPSFPPTRLVPSVEAGSKAILSNWKLSSKAHAHLGREIRDQRKCKPSSSSHHPHQHGAGGADHRLSSTGHFNHGHSTPRNVWDTNIHAGHQQSNQLRTLHSQPPRRDQIKAPRPNAYRSRAYYGGERGESRSFVKKENSHPDSSEGWQ